MSNKILVTYATCTGSTAGERDPFYSPTLVQETAAGIPNARLILYPGMGHPASGRQFKQDVLAFLREGRDDRGLPSGVLTGRWAVQTICADPAGGSLLLDRW